MLSPFTTTKRLSCLGCCAPTKRTKGYLVSNQKRPEVLAGIVLRQSNNHSPDINMYKTAECAVLGDDVWAESREFERAQQASFWWGFPAFQLQSIGQHRIVEHEADNAMARTMLMWMRGGSVWTQRMVRDCECEWAVDPFGLEFAGELNPSKTPAIEPDGKVQSAQPTWH